MPAAAPAPGEGPAQKTHSKGGAKADADAAAPLGSSVQAAEPKDRQPLSDAGEPPGDKWGSSGGNTHRQALAARYTKPLLKTMLQLMGCKQRHAHKASSLACRTPTLRWLSGLRESGAVFQPIYRLNLHLHSVSVTSSPTVDTDR